MPNSRHWSNASAPCRLEWRPSRLLAWGLRGLGVLGGVSLLACELPLILAVPAALLAVFEGQRQARFVLFGFDGVDRLPRNLEPRRQVRLRPTSLGAQLTQAVPHR